MFFGLGFWNRKVSYEVFLQQDGRWQLDAICDDEDGAIHEAKHILATGRSKAVRVVRLRTLSNGAGSETVIYEQEVKVAAERPLSISTPSGEVVLCRSLDDLLATAGRRTVGQVMRDYLQRTGISATELLHNWSHIRKLQDKGGLVMAAVHRVAGIQAEAAGQSKKERVQTIDALLEEASRRARDFASERGRYPSFQGHDLPGFAATVTGLAGERSDYVLTSLLTVWLFEIRSLAGKVDVLVPLIDGVDDPRLLALIDGLVADCLGFAEVVQDLFGAQASLGQCLIRMAGVIQGREADIAALREGALKRVGRLIQAGQFPECRTALTARLMRELAGDRPLDARNPTADPRLLDELETVVKDADGQVLGGEAMLRALDARRLKQRQSVLRAQGLHHVADNLRSGQA